MDGNGIPIGLAVDGANRNDMKMARATLESIPADAARPQPDQDNPQNLCLDKGYDFDEVREIAKEFQFTAAHSCAWRGSPEDQTEGSGQSTAVGGGTDTQLDESVSRHIDTLEQKARKLHCNAPYGFCFHHIWANGVIRIGSKGKIAKFKRVSSFGQVAKSTGIESMDRHKQSPPATPVSTSRLPVQSKLAGDDAGKSTPTKAQPVPVVEDNEKGILRLKHKNKVGCVAFSPDGKSVATGEEYTYGQASLVRIWDAAGGKEIHHFEGTPGSVRCLAFSRDGKKLAAAYDKGRDTSVLVWDLTTWKAIKQFSGKFAFSPANSGASSEVDVVWRMAGMFQSIAFSPDDKLLAWNDDKVIRVCDAETGLEIGQIQGDFHSLAFSPDGKTLASGSKDKTVRLWDAVSGKELRQFLGQADIVMSLVFSPDGKTLATLSKDGARLWDMQSGKQVSRVQFFCESVAFCPDDKMLASGLGGSVSLREMTSGKEYRRLQLGSDCLMFSPDGSTLALGQGKNVILWKVDARKGSRQIFLDVPGTCMAFSPDGKTLAVAGSIIRTNSAVNNYLASQFCLWDAVSCTKMRDSKGIRAKSCA